MAKNFINKNKESSEAVKYANRDLVVEPKDIACRWRKYSEAL